MEVKFKLYGQDEFFDVFKDESVKYTRQSNDFEKIDEIWNDYSGSFTLPASIKNNKLFSHYYDISIQGGFDPFQKNACQLYLDGELYSNGSLRLVDVILKDTVPSFYKVGFFSDKNGLNDILGDFTLSDLDFSGYNHNLDRSDAALYLDGGIVSGLTGSIIYPITSVNERLTWYNYGDLRSIKDASPVGSTQSGIVYEDIRPMIKITDVFDTISSNEFTTQGLTGSVPVDITFDLNNIIELKELYLYVDNGNDREGLDNVLVNYSKSNFYIDVFSTILFTDLISDNSNLYNPTNGKTTITYGGQYEISGTYVIGPILNVTPINLKLYVNNFLVETITGLSNTYNFTPLNLNVGDIVELRGTGSEFLNIPYLTFKIKSLFIPPTNLFEVNKFIPKVKIIDFIKSLTKMFNLTIYNIGDNVYKFETRDSYYLNNIKHEITKYVDTSTITISPVSTVYKSFDMKFKTSEDYDNTQYELQNDKEYGSSKYETSNYYGSGYKIETLSNATVWSEMVGYSSDGIVETGTKIPGFQSADSTNGKVESGLRFAYYNGVKNVITTAGNSYAITNRGGLKDPNLGTTFHDFRSYSENLDFNLSFNSEYDYKYNSTLQLERNLFTEFYLKWILRLYNPDTRKITIDLYMPNQLLRDIDLRDTLIINNKEYLIEKMDIDLNNEKAKMVLINRSYINSNEIYGLQAYHKESYEYDDYHSRLQLSDLEPIPVGGEMKITYHKGGDYSLQTTSPFMINMSEYGIGDYDIIATHITKFTIMDTTTNTLVSSYNNGGVNSGVYFGTASVYEGNLTEKLEIVSNNIINIERNGSLVATTNNYTLGTNDFIILGGYSELPNKPLTFIEVDWNGYIMNDGNNWGYGGVRSDGVTQMNISYNMKRVKSIDNGNTWVGLNVDQIIEYGISFNGVNQYNNLSSSTPYPLNRMINSGDLFEITYITRGDTIGTVMGLDTTFPDRNISITVNSPTSHTFIIANNVIPYTTTTGVHKIRFYYDGTNLITTANNVIINTSPFTPSTTTSISVASMGCLTDSVTGPPVRVDFSKCVISYLNFNGVILNDSNNWGSNTSSTPGTRVQSTDGKLTWVPVI